MGYGLQTSCSQDNNSMREKQQPRPQTNIQRSKSVDVPNSKVSQSNSLRSQVIVNKVPCESHYFEMRPITDSFDIYYQQRIQFFFTHEMKESRPYPILLREFVDVQYLPIFGNETQIQTFRKHKNKYRSSFYDEKSKASVDEATKKDLITPVPKHKYCQVCKGEFQQYEKHICEYAHIKKMRESFGNDAIDDCIEEYAEMRQNEKETDEVLYLRRMIATLSQSKALFQLQLRNYAEELRSYKNMGKK